MGTVETPQNLIEETGRTYTHRLRASAELQVFFSFLGIAAYGFSDLHSWVATTSKALTSSFYLQVTLCWIPVWMICAGCAVLGSWYRFTIDRKFHVSNSDLRPIFMESLKTNALSFAFSGMILLITFSSHRWFPLFGWIWAAIFCSFLYSLVNALLPWLMSLFYPVVPLRDMSLHNRLTRLADKANLRLGTVLEWQISGRSRQANALVSGVGKARRILLTDTLIAKLSPEETESIVAHEFGHCVLHHIWKRTLLQLVLFCGIFFVINGAVGTSLVWFADKYNGWNDVKLVPGIFFYWSMGNIYSNILMTALARRQEKAADRYSWQLMERTQPFISAMRKLNDLNLIVFDRDSQWKYSHPPTADRIAAAERHEKDRLEAVSIAQAAGQ